MRDKPLGPAGLRGKPASESAITDDEENVAARAILADSSMAVFALSKTLTAGR
jgi:hypothetical protein